MRRLALTLLAVLSLAISSQAKLEVGITGVPDSMRIGDPLEVILNLEMPLDGQLLMPDLPQVIPPFELLSAPEMSSLESDIARRHTQLSLRVTCYEPGDQVFQPIPVKWVSEDGSLVDSVASEPYIVYIGSVIPDEILALADTTQQPHHLLQPNRGKKVGYSLSELIPWLLILLALIAGYFLIRWLIRRRKTTTEEIEVGPPPRPPHEIALEELDRLRDRKLYQSGEIKPYYSNLSEIIRRYIEALYSVPAMESTSFQLLRDIESKFSDTKLMTILQDLLSDADLAKFAKYIPDAGTCQKDLENSYTLINRTKPAPAPLISEEAA